MKVRAIFESGSTRIVLAAESEAEKRMLGVLGSEMRATAEAKYEGHQSYGKVIALEVTLEPVAPGSAA